MTISGLGVKLGMMLLAGLLCTASVVGEQREGSSNTARSSSESDKPSSEAKQPSSQKTKRTPFGRSKSNSEQKPKPDPPATTPFMQVEEKGDSIVFKRRTPFGIQAWTKKRSEMTPEEQEMLRDHQAKQAEVKPAKRGAPSSKATPAAR